MNESKLQRDIEEAEQAYVDSFGDVDFWAEELIKRVVRYAKHWQLHHDPYEAMDRLAVAWLVLDDDDLMFEEYQRRKHQAAQAEAELCPKCKSYLMPIDHEAGAMWPYCRRCQKFVHPGDVVKKKSEKEEMKPAQKRLAENIQKQSRGGIGI